MKDADLFAKKLRDKGYDVRVIVADVGGKTWHRVQVGELASQQEAVDLQKSLKSSEKLEQTFVASR
jgi:cell division protein FtsN